MIVEEHFAHNALDNSDTDSISSIETVEVPVKRYATRPQNASTVIKYLKEENVKQMRTALNKEESEQIRYLSLDNASKDVEIQELKDEIKKYEAALIPFKMYEEVFKNFQKNLQTYKRLIDEVNNKDYRELIMCESHEIIMVQKPEIEVTEFKYNYSSLENIYNIKYNEQQNLSNELHEKMMVVSIKKRRMYMLMDYSIIIVIILIYFILQNYFGK
jgi:hypothetical protein